MLNLLLKDIAEKQDLFIQGTASLKDLMDLMNTNKKGVVVVLENETPVGILTERDVVEALYGGVSLHDNVDRYIKRTVISARGDRTIDHALDLTVENNIRRIVITDDSNRFLGIVTQQDLLRYLEEDFYRLTIKVKHVLKKQGNLISVTPDDTLKNVLKVIAENRISAVAVLRGKKAAGVITEKDILKLACARVPLLTRVGEHMSSPAVSVSLDTPLVDVVSMMNSRGIRRVVVEDSEGSAIDMITIRDVIKNLEKDINKFFERKLKSAKDILNLLPEMLIEVTDTGNEQLIIWANESVTNKFGQAIIDRPVTDLIPRESWDKICAALNKSNRIADMRFKKGDEVYELSGFRISTEVGTRKARLQLIMRDITEDVKLSTVDPLTSIYNRRFINEFLMKEIERDKRYDKPFSLAMCDLDDFKKINDTYGHLAGDIVLKSFSRIITGSIRNLDVVGRYGGDEFMIILPEASREIAVQIVERIVRKVEETEIPLPKGVSVKIGASFGISTFPVDGMSSDDLLICTDERLYKAKSLGTNRIVSV